MCAPNFRGGAYLAASAFVYRSILLVVNAISCAITDYKMTYLNVPYLEEFMLHLIYFVPLFISSGFALMGLDEESFNFVFYSALGLSTTLFIRYSAELSYIYAYDWSAFRLKTPSLFLNILVDFIFVSILFFYACHELRDPVHEKQKLANNNSNSSTRYHQTPGYSTPGTPGPLLSSTPTNNCNIQNEFRRENVKCSNREIAGTSASYASKTNKPKCTTSSSRKGIGYGAEEGDALHYPISPVDKESQMKPLPALPPGTPYDCEFDDISLPPRIPLASPERDDV